MTQEYADSSFLLGEKALTERDAIRSVRTYARKLFAEIAVRIVAFAADMIVILFVMKFLDDHVFSFVGLGDEFRTSAWVLSLAVYLTASWVSPLRATPMQFLFGMRVLSDSGKRLSLRDAAIRSVALIAQWGLALFLLKQFIVVNEWVKLAAVALLFYVPSVTARRQGLHDLLARSVVINKRALRSDDDERRMRDFLVDQGAEMRRSSRPSIYNMVVDAVVLALPVFAMSVAIETSKQKNMYARMAYAMTETLDTRQRAQSWFEATGDWPKTEAELGRPLRHNYPAGGYYQLEPGGVIRIQFEVRPELKNGSILYEPQVSDGKVTWQCRTVGDIEQRFVPRRCRD